MTTLLPSVRQTDSMVANIKSVAAGSSRPGGALFMKVDDRTGAITVGKENSPFPPGHIFVVGLHDFYHGYIDMQGGQVVDRKMVPIGEQPVRPVPAGGYGTYEGGGPRSVIEITLHCVDEPGNVFVFTAWGISSANRVDDLLAKAANHTDASDGLAGYIHPVINVKSSKYHLQAKTRRDGTMIPARDLWHWDYDIVDWLHKDGKTLLSAGVKPAEVAGPTGAETAPWDDEELTDAERELLGAAE